jgi:hypothetical protein
MDAANTLDPFAMWPAFPAPDYYGSSAPPRPRQPTTGLPTRLLAAAQARDDRDGSHVHSRSVRRDRRPAMPLQHRRGYAADLHRGLLTGDITQSRSSPPDTTEALPTRVRAATQPISARFELVALLRSVQPPVPHVRLSVSLAEPGPSGSTGPPRRCRGVLPPSPASPGSGCPQLQPGRCDGPAMKVSHLHSVRERLVALEVGHPEPVRGRRAEPAAHQVSRAARSWVRYGRAPALAAAGPGQARRATDEHRGQRAGLRSALAR